MGEATGGKVWENFADCLFVLVGQGAVGEHQVIILIPFLPRQRSLRPLMLFGSVVTHQIHHQADAALPQGSCHLAQIVHAAQLGVDFAVVGHGVATIIGAAARLEQGHQVQIGDA